MSGRKEQEVRTTCAAEIIDGACRARCYDRSVAAVRIGKAERYLFAAFVLCAGLSAIPFLITYRMPMSDVPQHAAQIAIWKHFADDCYRFAARYEINWGTPYLLGMLLVRAFATVASINAAFKVVAYLTVLALPLVLLRLTRFSGIEPWLALLGFPLAFGFSFYWGFVNFMVATPIALLTLLALFERRRARWVTVFAVAVALCHSLAYAIVVALALPMLLTRWRTDWMYAAALLVPAPILAGWAILASAQQARAHEPWMWRLGHQRILAFFDHLLSPGGDAQGTWVGLLMVVLLVLAGVRFAPDWRRWIPFATAVVLYLFTPIQAFGQSFLFGRLALFGIATLMLALSPGTPPVRVAVARTLIVALTITWLVVLSARFRAFHRDADAFDALVDVMPANRRVLYLDVYPRSVDVAGVPFIHFVAYYQQRKGGEIGWSFASNFPNIIHYRPDVVDVDVLTTARVTQEPYRFDWARDSAYDFFVVRSPIDMTSRLFKDAGGEVRLARRHGIWWLYARGGRPAARDCAPLEPDHVHAPFLERSR